MLISVKTTVHLLYKVTDRLPPRITVFYFKWSLNMANLAARIEILIIMIRQTIRISQLLKETSEKRLSEKSTCWVHGLHRYTV